MAPEIEKPEADKNDDRNTLAPGFVTVEDILRELPVYQKRFLAYEPSAEAMKLIRGWDTPTQIKVVFGDWCTDSRKFVPQFIKVVESSRNYDLHCVFLNVDREKKEPADQLDKLAVKSLPTFIVIVEGKEKGRIVESPQKTIEEDLVKILLTSAR